MPNRYTQKDVEEYFTPKIAHLFQYTKTQTQHCGIYVFVEIREKQTTTHLKKVQGIKNVLKEKEEKQ